MISNIIALIAVLVSIISMILTLKSTRASERLSEREIELVRFQLQKAQRDFENEKKADVSARLYKVDRTTWRLRVYNNGPAEANNVRLILDEQNEIVTVGACSGKFPMARMERHQSVDIFTAVHMGSPRKEWLCITWDDSSGIDRVNKVEITL